MGYILADWFVLIVDFDFDDFLRIVIESHAEVRSDGFCHEVPGIDLSFAVSNLINVV